jgi:hypothetical protein
MPDRDRDYVEFVEAAGGALRRTAYLVCGDWHKADDIVQANDDPQGRKGITVTAYDKFGKVVR